MYWNIMRYIAVDFLKKGHFAVDFQLNRVERCRMTTTLAHNILRLQIGRTVEFHCWNCRVPQLELPSSTAGTGEFHCWNSRVPPLEFPGTPNRWFFVDGAC